MDFQEIVNTYREVSDNDMDTHYLLMIESSSLQYHYESMLDEENKSLAELKTVLDAVEARRSKELSEKSVTEGARQAKFDEQVLKAKEGITKQKFVCDSLQTHINFLERVYFTCKETLARGVRVSARK